FEDVVWFKIGVGRRQNAEPRWILPLLCRRGHITRNEIGAIRVGQFETWFQVPSQIAPKFAEAIARTASSEDEQDAIVIEEAPEGPRIEARQNRRDRHEGGPRVRPKPFGKGPGKKGPHGGPGGKKPGAPFKKGPKAGGKKFAGKRKPGGKPSS
ncbi:MAG: DbpA RNA binding domain-containing protein, partial [Erythrobacter sp.]|nr:DbpA RNA binding domain-containing protein [Erythrobacter sp.]